VFGQGLPHTHSPIKVLVDLLTSPGGGLLWDVFLLALGIYVTVVILRRDFEDRERRRWRPARQYLYRQLDSDADRLLGLLPPDIRARRPGVGYGLGTRGAIDHGQERDFGRSLTMMREARLAAATEEFANNPYLLERFKQSLDTKLEDTGAVFLAQEPELNRILSELQDWMSGFEGNLKGYREARKSVAAGAGSIMFEQACVHLKQMIVVGSWLRAWLLEQATEIELPNPDSARDH
jgi:hypothetical protein